MMGSPTSVGDALESYDFQPPAECLVFEPTADEWKDAMAYIEKIRPQAEQCGIVKIRPPEDWQPPFAVDVDKLRFTPRIQRLNELEANTRVKLNFLDQVAKFWELQGSSLKIPLVEKRALDLYTLKKYVQKEGGVERVNEQRLWGKIATDIGYSTKNKNIGQLLKAHYERILYPRDIFEREENRKLELAMKAETKEEAADGGDADDAPDKAYVPHNMADRDRVSPPHGMKAGGKSKMGGGRPVGRMTGGRAPDDDSKSHGGGGGGGSPTKKEDAAASMGGVSSFSKELARLQFSGAGPKMSIPTDKQQKEKTRGLKLNFDYDPLAKYMCLNCNKGDAEEQMLLCDGCDDSYHTFCLMPPLSEIPKGDWRCPKCVAAEVSKPMEAYGFEQAQKEYTLQSFGEMADQFKSDYFNMPVHLIPTSLVEKEYWRILANIDEDVICEYGADLHTIDHGSGFPTIQSKNLSKEDEVYAKSEWNLNTMPVVPNSILHYIGMDISGMVKPWLYVGMCFSTFCWHTEDHWMASVNYLHWGEPKSWYGFSAKYAEQAEKIMKDAAPELFDSQPDLLHHVVTTMNPNRLMAAGIPVYRTDQHAGEFIVTFPRCYHAGFNQGYNLAEAVNFAAPGWVEMGRKCIDHYSAMRRYCVFSHDELVCKMATQADKLTLEVAASVYKDMLVMIEQEKKARRALLEAGVTDAEREAFELLVDDERQCAICKTTCFLSALTSVDHKDQNEIVCLRHFKSMECEPAKLVLRYRYTLDELATLLTTLRRRAEAYNEWVDKVKRGLEAKGDTRLEFDELKELFTEAQERKYPDSDLLEVLTLTMEEAEKCQTVATQLGNKKVRTRTRGVVDAKYRLTVEELQLFTSQLDTLPTIVSGQDAVRELLQQVEEFRVAASKLLQREKPEAKEIQDMIDLGVSLDVDLPELTQLKGKHKQSEWLEEVNSLLENLEESSLDNLKELLESGMALPTHHDVEKALGEISGLITQVSQWEEKAKVCLAAKPRLALLEIERLVTEGEAIGGGLPSLGALKELVRKARDWLSKAETLANPENFPYLDTMEALVGRGRPLPLRLDPLPNLETQVASARAWRERTARVFLKKNSHPSLLEILSPRHDVAAAGAGADSRRKKKAKEGGGGGGGGADAAVPMFQHPIFQDLSAKELGDPQAIVRAFKEAESRELGELREFRAERRAATEAEAGDEEMAKKRRVMLECELCLQWFHPAAVPLPKAMTKDKTTGKVQLADESAPVTSLRDIRFLCPACLRSRRPRLETILSLLVSLQKLSVRLPEGEALQCLTERAMSWQDRARQALAADDVAKALTKLSQHQQKQQKLQERMNQRKEAAATAAVDKASASASRDGGGASDDGDGPVAAAAGANLGAAAAADDAAHELELPNIDLAAKTMKMLDDLLMEGDLLEVSLDEIQHIWRVLQATEPRRSKVYPDLDELETALENVRDEKLRARKKRKLELQEKQQQQQQSSSGDGESPASAASVAAAAATKSSRKDDSGGGGGAKKRKLSGEAGGGGGGSGGSASAGGGPAMTTTTPQDKKRQRKKKSGNAKNSDDEGEQDCSANPKCMKPSGKEVHWVQCDGCEQWFHLYCIGLKPEQVSENEDFICKACRPNYKKGKKDKKGKLSNGGGAAKDK